LLKKKLGYNIELKVYGINKLKDLLLSMHDEGVRILRNTENQPFAIFVE
jgi:hypothetical protein